MPLHAITLDLDDTLWPMAPTLRRAEALMQDWLRQHAPATVAAHDKAAWAALRRGVVADRPDWAHDLSALRRETIRRALLAAGDDPALADPAFAVFFDARQQVDLFDDVLPALAWLSARWQAAANTAAAGLARPRSRALSAAWKWRPRPGTRCTSALPLVKATTGQRAGAAPAHTLHVGDDPALDVDGALAAGLQAAWVRRPALPDIGAPTGVPHHVVASLTELADRLGV